MILRSFDHRGWSFRRSCKSSGLRNSLPGWRNEQFCAAIDFSKSIRIERRSFELKAAAASVFWNLNMDFFGVGHSFEMIFVIVLTSWEEGIGGGFGGIFRGYVNSPSSFGVIVSFLFCSRFVWCGGSLIVWDLCGLCWTSQHVEDTVVGCTDDILATNLLSILIGMYLPNCNVSIMVGGIVF